MLKIPAISLTLIALSSFSAIADECGRWVPCPSDSELNVEQARSYVYGETREVEPWAEDEVKSSPDTPGTKALAAAPSPGVSKAAEKVELIGRIERESQITSAESPLIDPDLNRDHFPEDEAGVIVDLNPEEEAAMRAYLQKIDDARNAEETSGFEGVEIIRQ